MTNQVRVGVGVIVIKDNQILLGKRTGSHGAGSWAFPGGHLEVNENPEACAIREVAEETGLVITNLRRGPWTNDIFSAEGKHFITIYLLADWVSGQPKLLEPDKCSEWGWFDWKNLPEPLFLTIKNLKKIQFNPLKNSYAG